ncbi:MAG: HlyD family efflux transporter periplasmic adaptor subunit [Anaerolineae bacterium]|nr:HlyD family efflux transporter periplasmic adaptor subunit [Anaerolineae bacterium]
MSKWFVILLTVVALASVAGCTAPPGVGAPVAEAQGPQAGDPAQTVAQQPLALDPVLAEGRIEPVRSAHLAFEIGGEVVDVLVAEGDRVAAGNPLLRLDTAELALALRSAEQDVVVQRAALDALIEGASHDVIGRADKDAADRLAQAEVALTAQELRLQQAQEEDPGIAVSAARARVRQLELSLAQAQAHSPAPSVTTAEVALERAQIALADTQDEYRKALDRPWEEQDVRDAWTKRLEQAQLDYKAAQAQLDAAANGLRAHEVGLGILAAQIDEARAQLTQAIAAQASYSITLDIVRQEVEAARLQVVALQTWDNPYRDPPDDEQIAQAQAGLEKATIGVERLRLQMEDAELLAPFAGTVVDVAVEPGDQVSPGSVVVVLATLDQLEIRTVDLSELEIAGVAQGQRATVSVDAYPGYALTGAVTAVDLQAQDYRGDTVYAVTVQLDADQALPLLRWGMTALVEIQRQPPAP